MSIVCDTTILGSVFVLVHATLFFKILIYAWKLFKRMKMYKNFVSKYVLPKYKKFMYLPFWLNQNLWRSRLLLGSQELFVPLVGGLEVTVDHEPRTIRA